MLAVEVELNRGEDGLNGAAADAERKPVAIVLEIDAEVVGEPARSKRVFAAAVDQCEDGRRLVEREADGHDGAEDLAATSPCFERRVGVSPPLGWELDLETCSSACDLPCSARRPSRWSP